MNYFLFSLNQSKEIRLKRYREKKAKEQLSTSIAIQIDGRYTMLYVPEETFDTWKYVPNPHTPHTISILAFLKLSFHYKKKSRKIE